MKFKLKTLILSLGVIILMALAACTNIIHFYQVTFYDSDDVIIESKKVRVGFDAKAPNEPTKYGYTFVEWDQAFTNVRSDLAIRPIFEETEGYYNVVFFDDENNELKKERVLAGDDATAPDEPVKWGFTFIQWDQDFTNINEDLHINAVFEANPNYYTVVFVDAIGVELKREQVKEGEDATPPAVPIREGYLFVGWDRDYTNVKSYLRISALFELIPNVVEAGEYVKYVKNISFDDFVDLDALLANINLNNSLIYTFTNLIYGGFRNTNTMVHYDASNLPSRNTYGYEVGVAENGIVVTSGTLVDLPDGGYILSAHGTAITTLSTNVKIGDYLVHNKAQKTIKVYRDTNLSIVMSLQVTISNLIEKIEKAYYEQLLALNYELIMEKITSAITQFNELAASYSNQKFIEVKKLLTAIEFLLIETNPVETKAFWHYPLRSGGYTESNLGQVQNLLDVVVEMGFNKIYVNVTFGSYSIYKSQYLEQRLANNNTYVGYKDYLECFIEEAHKRGIKVAAWTNTTICGDGVGNISRVFRDRGWVQMGYNGEDNFNGMYYVDISNPDVQTHLVNVHSELASNYDLDGIEFDFIRFPSGNLYSFSGVITNPSSIKDAGYTESFMNLFKATYGYTGDVKALLLSSKTIRNEWLQFKQDLLTDLVEKLVNAMKTAKPNISISAAVMPSISGAINTYQQNWKLWVDNGWIDTLEPMIYSGDNNYVINSLTTMYNLVNGKADIVVGLFPENNGGLPELIAEQVDMVTNALPVGWCKFSSKQFIGKPELVEGYAYLKRHYTAMLTDSNNKKVYAYIYQLLDKTKHYYQYVDEVTNYQPLIDFLEQALKLDWDEQIDLTQVLASIKTELNKIDNSIIKTRLNNKHKNIIDLLR